MGVLYLIQERELKSRSPRAFYYLVPSLERCDTISGRSVAVGFALPDPGHRHRASCGATAPTAATGPGTPRSGARSSPGCIYVVLLLARRRTGWGGRQAALLGIAGFSAVVFTFVWMTVFSPTTGGALAQ